jgi:NAD(P)H-binding
MPLHKAVLVGSTSMRTTKLLRSIVSLIVVCCLLSDATVRGFAPVVVFPSKLFEVPKASTRSTFLFASNNEENASDFEQLLFTTNTAIDRRALFRRTTTAAVSAVTMATSLAQYAARAADDDDTTITAINNKPGSSPEHPLVVLGGGGKTGKLCTTILAKQGLHVRCVTRSGRKVLDDDNATTPTTTAYVSYAVGDVTNYAQMKAVVQGASGVIFAASASGKNQGGDPAHVDYLGVYQAAKACLEQQVPKLVLVSAGTITRPDSLGFKATNSFAQLLYGDKIMDYKIAGEAAMRDLYRAANNNNNTPALSYAVVRPGGLSDKPAVGPSQVHISQGDVYASEVSRQDVAEVTVAALLSATTDFVTFEVNQVEGLAKAMSSLPDLPKELVHAGAFTYSGLLLGLLPDAEMQNRYPSLVNDFRGSGIEPLASLM